LFSGRMAFAVLSACLATATAARAAAPSASGEVFPFKVEQTTLDNGFKVLVIPYDSPGTIAYFTVVRTGSRDEIEPGHSGFAHLFEHIMFRGTERYGQDKYAAMLKQMGADNNASTRDDVTEYHIIGPSAELETLMDLESDRFKNLKYTEEQFKTEALAVLGEYNKNASNPGLPLEEKLRDVAFTQHTYRHTTLGFLADVQAMPKYYEFSIAFHDRFYRPENCTLVIVGDAQADKVFALAKRYYGDWKRGYKATDIPVETPQREPKSAHLDWANPTHPYLVEGYHAPAFSVENVDFAALDLIGQLLFGESAPLYQDLVNNKQWADFIQGGPEEHRDPYLFSVFARVKSEAAIAQVQDAISKALEDLKTHPVDPARLDRIKSHLRYAFALGLSTPAAVAYQVLQAIALTGDVSSINALFAQYQKVTPADIQRMATQVFRAENQTVVTLSHPGGDKPAQKPGGAR
jgi:zinc protease